MWSGIISGVGAVVVAAAYGVRRYLDPERARRRTLRRAPARPIGELDGGARARIDGEIEELEGTVEAPLSRRPCAYCELTVEQHVSYAWSRRWEVVVREVVGVPFAIRDATGRARVDPRAAYFAVAPTVQERSGTLDDATAREEALLERHGMTSRQWLFNKALRYRERALVVGQRVTALGNAVRERDPDAPAVGGYRDAPPTWVRLAPRPGAPLLVADVP